MESSKLGFSDAVADLAIMISYGEGITKDQDGGIKLTRLAAELGDAYAEVRLANMYLAGNQYVKKDKSEAFVCYGRLHQMKIQ